MDFRAKHIGCYTKKESLSQKPSSFFLVLHVRGYKKVHFGSIRRFSPPPFMALVFPDEIFSFETTSARENYVVLFDCDDLEFDSETGGVAALLDNERAVFPRFLALGSDTLAIWRERFSLLNTAMLEPTTLNKIRLNLLCAAAVNLLMESGVSNSHGGVAAELKRLIDSGRYRNLNLKELARRCGYSADYLRLQFKREYGLLPQHYRQKQRLDAAMHLIGSSSLSLAEISESCGFAHVSYFNMLFRKHFGITPGEALKRNHNHSKVAEY